MTVHYFTILFVQREFPHTKMPVQFSKSGSSHGLKVVPTAKKQVTFAPKTATRFYSRQAEEGGGSDEASCDKGDYFDDAGNYYDCDGGYYDEEGYYFDSEGGIYDPDGGYYDPEGYYYDPDGTVYVFDEEGEIVGYYGEDGEYVDTATGDDSYGVEGLEDLTFQDQTSTVPNGAVFATAPEPEYDPDQDFTVPEDENIQQTGACIGDDCGSSRVSSKIMSRLVFRGSKGKRSRRPPTRKSRVVRPGTGAIMPVPGSVVGERALIEILLPSNIKDWPELGSRALDLPASKVEQQMDAGYLRFQGSTSTCVLHAFCGLWYHEMRKIDPKCSYPSRLWMTAYITGACGTSGGSDPNASFSMASNIGMLPEGVIKDDSSGFQSITSSQCSASPSYSQNSDFRIQAAKFKTKGSGRPTYLFQDFSFGATPSDKKAKLIYGSLAAGFPVMIFMTVGTVQVQGKGSQSVYTLAGSSPITSLPRNTNYHAVVLCGFKVVDGLPCFRLKNSWAIDVYQNGVRKSGGWGDDGYTWLSAESEGMSSVALAVSYKDNPFGVPAGTQFRGPVEGPPIGTAIVPPQAADPKPGVPVKPAPQPTLPPRPLPSLPPPRPTPTTSKPPPTDKPTVFNKPTTNGCVFYQTSNCAKCQFPSYAQVITTAAGKSCVPCKQPEEYEKICGKRAFRKSR